MTPRKIPWLYWGFWAIALAGAVWLYFYPIDDFVPASRSQRRPVPVSFAEEKDKDSIASDGPGSNQFAAIGMP